MLVTGLPKGESATVSFASSSKSLCVSVSAARLKQSPSTAQLLMVSYDNMLLCTFKPEFLTAMDHDFSTKVQGVQVGS